MRMNHNARRDHQDSCIPLSIKHKLTCCGSRSTAAVRLAIDTSIKVHIAELVGEHVRVLQRIDRGTRIQKLAGTQDRRTDQKLFFAVNGLTSRTAAFCRTILFVRWREQRVVSICVEDTIRNETRRDVRFEHLLTFGTGSSSGQHRASPYMHPSKSELQNLSVNMSGSSSGFTKGHESRSWLGHKTAGQIKDSGSHSSAPPASQLHSVEPFSIIGRGNNEWLAFVWGT